MRFRLTLDRATPTGPAPTTLAREDDLPTLAGRLLQPAYRAQLDAQAALCGPFSLYLEEDDGEAWSGVLRESLAAAGLSSEERRALAPLTV